MSNENKVCSVSGVDLENEIPLTAIVDIKLATLGVNCRENLSNKNRLKFERNPEMDEIKYVCRVCLMPEKNMFSLLSKIGCDSLSDMFSIISSIRLHQEEFLPMQLCGSCYNSVIDCYKFRQKCIKSNNILRSLIFNTNTNKCIDDEVIGPLNKMDKTTQTNIGDATKANSCENAVINKNEESCIEVDGNLKVDNNDHEEIEYLDDEIFYIDDNKTEDRSSSKPEIVKLEDINKVPSRCTKKTKMGRTCKHCSMRFVKPKLLRAHILQCHSANVVKIFACEQCKESFSCRDDLDIHSALHVKGNQWTCNKCFKIFNVRNKFRRHIRRHMQSLRHECVCGKTFPELHALRRHARVHTGERAEKKYTCDVCDKRFCDSSQLSAHMSRHTGARPCACECGKAFPSRRLLASHRRVHDDHKRFPCDYCDKRFRHESTRNTHHRTHTGEKPYVCSICGKTFIQNSNLRQHMRTHTGEKPYTCDVCSRKFSSGSSLKCHRRIHTGEKPYSCHICGKRFARTDLRTHMRVHSGERPFVCCVCSKNFANAARLREHYLVHTGEKPFECAICTEQFKRKSYLAKHMKSHNKETQSKKKNTVIVSPRSLVSEKNRMIRHDKSNTKIPEADVIFKNSEGSIMSDVPLEVSEELVLQDDGNINYEDVQMDINTDCTDSEPNIYNKEFINIEEIKKPLELTPLAEGNVVKLYQLDQSLVQIQTSSSHITIHKVSSKITTNLK